jgi:hypothetical protein
MKMSKEFTAAWETVFKNLTAEQQEIVLASPDGKMSAALALHAERLVEARKAATGKGAGQERQLVERLEMENPI